MLAGVTLAATLPSCASHGRTTTDLPASSPMTVVATFYPLAWMAEQIGGDVVAVTNLTPPGVEPHDLELAPDQVDRLANADLAVVLGRQFQPGPEKVAVRRKGPTVTVLSSQRADADPHIWLDPVRFSEVRTEMVAALSALRPSEAAGFGARSATLGESLAALDAEYQAGLETCRRRLIVSTHAAFGRLAKRYGLTQEGIAGLSPDAEPDPERLADLADLVRSSGSTTVFTEEMAPKEFAQTLAREAGVSTRVLSPIEGLTAGQIKRGGSYLTVMRENLAALQRALGCTT
jgi:zinc transport system substrate-binding protein